MLAALVKAGDLHPDFEGDVTLEDVYQALNDKTWDSGANANIQAVGIAVYNEENKESEIQRSRCLPGSPCLAYKKIHGTHTHTNTNKDKDTQIHTIHTHIYTYTHIHTHTHTYIHIHTHTYTHIHIHTHIHTHV